MNAIGHIAPARNPLARRNTALLLRGRYNAWRWTFAVFAGLVLLMLALGYAGWSGAGMRALGVLIPLGVAAVSLVATDTPLRRSPVIATLPVPRERLSAAFWWRAVLAGPLAVTVALAAAIAVNAVPFPPIFVVDVAAATLTLAAWMHLAAARAVSGPRPGIPRPMMHEYRFLWFMFWAMPYIFVVPIFRTMFTARDDFLAHGGRLFWIAAVGLSAWSWMRRQRLLMMRTRPHRPFFLFGRRRSRYNELSEFPLHFAFPCVLMFSLFILFVFTQAPADLRLVVAAYVFAATAVVRFISGAAIRAYRVVPMPLAAYVVARVGRFAALLTGSLAILWFAAAFVYGFDPDRILRGMLALWMLGAVFPCGAMVLAWTRLPGWVAGAVVMLPPASIVLMNWFGVMLGIPALEAPWHAAIQALPPMIAWWMRAPLYYVGAAAVAIAFDSFLLTALALYRTLLNPLTYRTSTAGAP